MHPHNGERRCRSGFVPSPEYLTGASIYQTLHDSQNCSDRWRCAADHSPHGIETAQRLRAADPDLLIVFVTSSPEYVWDAFPVHPFDYLLKPYKEEKFEQLAGELRRVLCRQQPELEVRIARQIVRLPLTKIYYATAQNHYVRVVTDDGECRATANFAQVQEQLQTQPEFLVCNRGVIINMSKVLRFEGDCIEMLDGTHLPVRQKDKNSLLAQFTQYQFRGMQREF